MIDHPQNNQDAATEGQRSAKQAYARPMLTRLGTLRQLTRQNGSATSDGGSAGHRHHTGRGGRNGGTADRTLDWPR